MLGRPRLHLREVGSTNDRARDLAVAGAPHGTLVSTDLQTAGRGRQGRRWEAPAGSALLLSIVLREADALLPLRGGLAVADLVGPGAQVKWPNDVLLDDRKVAGVLAEGRPQEGWWILGMGVNLALDPAALPPDLRDRVGTLERDPAEREPALAALLAHVERRLAEAPEEILAELRARDALAGRHVAWDGGEGVGAGIARDGSLRVRRPDGREELLGSGEVHLRPPA